jgi:hypothetical protein
MAGGSQSFDASGVSDRGLIGKLMRLKSAAVNIRRLAAQNRFVCCYRAVPMNREGNF